MPIRVVADIRVWEQALAWHLTLHEVALQKIAKKR